MAQSVFAITEELQPDSDLFGGKGASLIQLVRAGVPIPPGFIVSTEAGKVYHTSDRHFPQGLDEQIATGIMRLQEVSGKTFGGVNNPLLVSVRSGAPVSMPGLMSTILNVGLNQEIVDAMPDRRFGLELFWRLHRMFGSALEIDKEKFQKIEAAHLADKKVRKVAELAEPDLEALIQEFRDLMHKNGIELPNDPEEQLESAIKAIWESWNTQPARSYRKTLGVSDKETHTAVVVQQMVFGNKDQVSGSGVAYSRDLITGKSISGSFLFRAQGEDIVGGEGRAGDLSSLRDNCPTLYTELVRFAKSLEQAYVRPLDIEFTVESGKLFFLQMREAPVSDEAKVVFLTDMVNSRKLTKEEAVELIRPSQMERLHMPVFSKMARKHAKDNRHLLSKGIPASSGAAVGIIAVSEDGVKRAVQTETPFIWVREALNPDEAEIMQRAAGVISIQSSGGSHGAIIANILKKPCVVCCENIEAIVAEPHPGYLIADGQRFPEGTKISVDGTHGEIFIGELPLDSPQPFEALREFQKWWTSYDGTKGNLKNDDGRPHSPWANACYISDLAVIDEMREKARALLTRHKWSSEKAQIVEVMKLLPESSRIKQAVFEANNWEDIRIEMYKVHEEGCWNGPRTASRSTTGKSAYQMGIKTEEQIERFFEDPDFYGVDKAKKYGGYKRWLNPRVGDEFVPPDQIIVMYDKPEKGVESVEREHFVCNVRCKSNPDEITVDINLGTVQLRSFESIKLDNLVTLKMQLNLNAPFLRGKKSLVFGRAYWRQDYIEDMARALQPDLDESMDEANIIRTAMMQGNLTENQYEKLVGTRALRIARYVEAQVLDEWWKPGFNLPLRMRALDEVYSLQVLEIQGRADEEGNIKWFLIYDAKGREEKQALRLAKSSG